MVVVANDWAMQGSQTNSAPVDRPNNTETTAAGAAYLAGLAAGMCPKPTGISQQWVLKNALSPNNQVIMPDTLLCGMATRSRLLAV